MLLKVELQPDTLGPWSGGWALYEGVSEPIWSDKLVGVDHLILGEIENAPGYGTDTEYWPGWYASIYHCHVTVEDNRSVRAVRWEAPDGRSHLLHASGAVYLMTDAGETIERL